MASSETKNIIIVGGGVTGTGIAAELSKLNVNVTIIEKGELGKGTSGHFHGMLHSGARYAVNDAPIAQECYIENQRLRNLIPSAIRDTGGLVLAFNDAEVEHSRVIEKACKNIGIPISEIAPSVVLSNEPNISKKLIRALAVPDGFIDSSEVIKINHQIATSGKYPAQFITNHTVTGFIKADNKITKVQIKNTKTNSTQELDCDYVINAAGVWSGQVANLASLELDMIFDKGTMIVFENKFTKAILNRSRPEDDGDLLVPDLNHSIMGTTARVINDPDICLPTKEEVDTLVREGSAMIPAMEHSKIRNIYAGVRPLILPVDIDIHQSTRSVSRSFKIIEYQDQGVENFLSIVGGKVTLYKKMAEETVKTLQPHLS